MKRRQVTFELAPELYDEMTQRCRAEGRTRSAVLRAFVALYVYDNVDPFAIASSHAATETRR